jgi:hypothetical protein
MLLSNQYILLLIILIIIIILCIHNNKFEFFTQIEASTYSTKISSINDYIDNGKDVKDISVASNIQTLQNLFVKKTDQSLTNELESKFNDYYNMISQNINPLNFNNISEKYKNICDDISTTISNIKKNQSNLSVVL